MKKHLRYILLLLLILPNVIFATSFNCSEAIKITSSYSARFKSFGKYITGDTGLLDKNTYEITRVGSFSYLYDGPGMWLLDSGSCISNLGIEEVNSSYDDGTNQKLGIKSTAYVDMNAEVVGSGTFNDPWIFTQKHNVTLKSNGHGKVVNGVDKVDNATYVVSDSGSKNITIYLCPDKGYKYLNNTCGGAGSLVGDKDANRNICNAGTETNEAYKLTFTNVNRDMDCNVSFGSGQYELTLNCDKCEGNIPQKVVYEKHGIGWFKDKEGSKVINSIAVPTRTGYVFQGFYIKDGEIKNNIINENGKFTTSTTILTENRAASIEWKATSYTVTIDNKFPDGKNDANATKSTTATYDSDMPNITPAKIGGYVLKGYFVKENGDGEKYYDYLGQSTHIFNYAKNITLYADWEQCKAGYYAPAGATSCTTCEGGRYTSGPGEENCKECPAGTSTNAEGKSSCKDCDVGYYAPAGANKCSKCPVGTYNNEKRQSSCLTCADGYYAMNSGSTKCDECPKNQESKEDHSGCVACPAGTSRALGEKRCSAIKKEITLVNGIIPNEYTQYDSLNGDGKNYVNLGVKANQSTGFKIRFKLNSSLSSISDIKYLLGSRDGDNKNVYEVGLANFSTTTSYKGFLNMTIKSNEDDYFEKYYNLGLSKGKTFTMSHISNNLFITSDDDSLGSSQLTSNDNYSNNCNLYLFATNNNGSAVGNSTATVYYLELYNGSKKTKSLVPAYEKSSKNYGLYDTLNDMFISYGNSNSGGKAILENQKITEEFDEVLTSFTAPSMDGYTLVGYYTKPNGAGTRYYNGDGTAVDGRKFTANDVDSLKELYAYWQ